MLPGKLPLESSRNGVSAFPGQTPSRGPRLPAPGGAPWPRSGAQHGGQQAPPRRRVSALRVLVRCATCQGPAAQLLSLRRQQPRVWGPALPEGRGLRVLSRPAGWCRLSWLDRPEPGPAAVIGERCRTWQRPCSTGVGALCSAQCRRHPGRGAEASGQSALLTWFTGVCGDQVPRGQGLPLEGVWVWRPSAE